MQRGGFPEDTAKLEKLLQSPEQLAAVVKEMEGFCDAYQANREILRFHFHRPNAILHRLEQAQIPAEVFPLDGQFKVERPTFITEDEINEVLAPGGGYSDSKLAAYVFFQNHTDRKERQDYLKESFGTGGSGSSIRDTWHDANQRAYLRKMAVDGYVVRVDMTDVKELAALLRTCSNNLNQIARRVNSTGNLYEEDIADLKTRYGELWGAFSSLLSKFEDL